MKQVLDFGIPGPATIIRAARRIAPFIHRTPVLSSASINKLAGCKIAFKCECFQKGGAFKVRGAANAILSTEKSKLLKGVATHSSGNHAQAVAMIAGHMRIPAYIVMPENSPSVKMDAVIGYGAEVITCASNLRAREKTLLKVLQKTGAYFIHPYNDYRIIAGQATACMELIENVKEPDYILAAVGGGGLLSGTALAASYFTKGTHTIGCEPQGADDAYRSLQAGKIIPSTNPKTVADGLLTSLCDKTFHIITKHVDEIITADDEMILYAMHLIWERMKIVVEPSAAVPLAVVLKKRAKFTDKHIGIILSGGNIAWKDALLKKG